MPVEPSEQQIAVLRAVCDTFVPSLDHTPDPHGFWARSGTDMGADQGILQMLATLPDDAGRRDAGAPRRPRRPGLPRPPAGPRASSCCAPPSLANRDAAGGIAMLGGLTLLLVYGAPDPQTGQNPNWAVFGFPGPISAPPDEPKPITPLAVDGDTELEADVAIVGSGAGGGVIAAQLAEAGLRVVVLEAGGYFNEADFNQSELWAYQNLYWRGGPNPTGDMNISLQAGSCLGGGTVVNWTNSLKTKPWVREQWAREFGLEDVGTEEWERHVDAVWQRLGVNEDCSDLNVPHQLMQAGAQALGWSFTPHHPQHRSQALRPRLRRLHGLRRPVRRQELDPAHVPPGRRRARRADPRQHVRAEGADGERARRGRRRRPHRSGDRRDARRQRDRAARRGGRRRAGVPRAAAALRDRRPGRGPAPAPASVHGDDGHLPAGDPGVVGPPAPGADRRVRLGHRRRRLRLPDRGRAVHDRCRCQRHPVVGRRAAQGVPRGLRPRGDVHRPDARPRRGPGRARRGDRDGRARTTR